MARLIEVQTTNELTASLTLSVGDVLLVRASGGYVESGDAVLDLLGPFVPGVIGVDQQVLAPQSLPTSVLFAARNPGQAVVAVFRSEGWGSPARQQRVRITVEG